MRADLQANKEQGKACQCNFHPSLCAAGWKEDLGVQVCWGQLRGRQVWPGPWRNFPPDFSLGWRRNSWWTESLWSFPVFKTGLCPNQIPPFPGCLVLRITAAPALHSSALQLLLCTSRFHWKRTAIHSLIPNPLKPPAHLPLTVVNSCVLWVPSEMLALSSTDHPSGIIYSISCLSLPASNPGQERGKGSKM